MTMYDDLVVTNQYRKLVNALREFLNDYSYTREDFRETPERVARMWQTFVNQPQICEMKHFPTVSDGGIICVKDFHAWSFCPHHLLPVQYTLKIGYVPHERALGLSKLGRTVQCIMSHLPLQEDVGKLVATRINAVVEPKGIGVIVHGEHLCMRMRGLTDPCVEAVSDHFEGVMRQPDYQQRFFQM